MNLIESLRVEKSRLDHAENFNEATLQFPFFAPCIKWMFFKIHMKPQTTVLQQQGRKI